MDNDTAEHLYDLCEAQRDRYRAALQALLLSVIRQHPDNVPPDILDAAHAAAAALEELA